MTRLLSLFAVALLALPATAQTAPQLVGAWEVLRVETSGGELTPTPFESVTMTFHADGRLDITMTAEAPVRVEGQSTLETETITARYRVEADRVWVTTSDEEDQPLQFRFEGDELVLAEADSGETAYLRRATADASSGQ